jgi:hypothetical protein
MNLEIKILFKNEIFINESEEKVINKESVLVYVINERKNSIVRRKLQS